MNTLDIALEYIAKGWSPIPIVFREKRPPMSGWQKLRINHETAPQYFNGVAQNVGVDPRRCVRRIDRYRYRLRGGASYRRILPAKNRRSLRARRQPARALALSDGARGQASHGGLNVQRPGAHS